MASPLFSEILDQYLAECEKYFHKNSVRPRAKFVYFIKDSIDTERPPDQIPESDWYRMQRKIEALCPRKDAAKFWEVFEAIFATQELASPYSPMYYGQVTDEIIRFKQEQEKRENEQRA